MKNLNFVFATIIFATSTSFADSVRVTATLAQPLPAKKDVIAYGNLWHCDGSTCVLASKPKDAASLITCYALEHEVGTLTAFGLQDKPFDAERLAKCNLRR